MNLPIVFLIICIATTIYAQPLTDNYQQIQGGFSKDPPYHLVHDVSKESYKPSDILKRHQEQITKDNADVTAPATEKTTPLGLTLFSI